MSDDPVYILLVKFMEYVMEEFAWLHEQLDKPNIPLPPPPFPPPCGFVKPPPLITAAPKPNTETLRGAIMAELKTQLLRAKERAEADE